MLKYIKHNLETITGIEVYPLISFVIFFAFFTLLLIWVFRADKNQIDKISRIPLDENQSEK